MTTRKPVLPVMAALLVDLGSLANGAKPHPKASREGDLRVLGIARDELTAAEACVRELRSIRRARGHEEGCACAMCRCLSRLDALTRPTRRTP